MSFVRDADGRVRWTRLRRIVQTGFVLVFALLPLTYHLEQRTVMGTLASLDLGPLSLVDPAAGIASLLAARAGSLSLLGGLILPVLLALTLGPVFCSWVCPWGLVSELLDRLRRRKPTRIPPWLQPLRWSTLGLVMAASLVVGLPVASLLSAPRLMTALPMEVLFLGAATVGTVSLLGGLLALELLLPRRLWCRALCPVGSTLVLLRTPWTLDVRWTKAPCQPSACGLRCVSTCPWNLDPRNMGRLDGCTNCGRCVEGCPAEPSPSLDFSFHGPGDRTPALPVLEREP